jgi:hypothetical protein
MVSLFEALSVETESIYLTVSFVGRKSKKSYLILDFKGSQGVNEGFGKRRPSVGPWHFNQIKEHRHRVPIVLIVHRNCHVRLVVGRRPGVSGKVQLPFKFLYTS